MAGNTVSILEGNTFVVSDLRGDINATPTDTTGLFAWDTRFLSRWLLTINGQTPKLTLDRRPPIFLSPVLSRARNRHRLRGRRSLDHSQTRSRRRLP